MRSIFVSIIKLGINAFLFYTCIVSNLYGQDAERIKVMQYNLLNYGVSPNTPANKDLKFLNILNYVQPDILGVNELGRGQNNPVLFLDGVLGSEWQAASYINTVNSQQVNMLYWKKATFDLLSQTSICNSTRDIILYRLYYKDILLNGQNDTVFLNIIVAHLKAGSAAADEVSRADETQCVMSFLNANGVVGNFIFMGDLNVYTDQEACYQNLTNISGFRFYDPINRPGNWHSNINFKDLHVQSTRRESLSDGGASGGLDDRFTQILVSEALMNNTHGGQYISGSYTSIGQDGNHYQKSINSAPANTAAPTDVIQALYEASDHLPVSADFNIKKLSTTTNTSKVEIVSNNFITIVNPIEHHQLRLFFNFPDASSAPINVELLDMKGQLLLSDRIFLAQKRSLSILLNNSISAGTYLLRVTQNGNYLGYAKVVIL